MKPCPMQESGAVDLYFYGELAAGDRLEVEAHVARCTQCRGALEDLRTIAAALAPRSGAAAPPGGDWASLMARIERGIAEGEGRPAESRLPPARPRRPPTPAYLAMAALVTLVAGSVAYLATHQERPVPAGTGATAQLEPASRRVDSPAPAPSSAERPRGRDTAFAAVSEQHFERSKLVILGLASRDAHTTSSADWAYERQLAETLLDDTRLYKQAAEARGLGSLAGVMSDLELVLLQASLADQRDAATLDRLQRLIQKRDLVSKMETTTF